MVNYVNFSNRNLPSVDYGRINVWNRQQQHAIDARNAALANCDCRSGLSGLSMMMPMPVMPMPVMPIGFGLCYPMPIFGFGFPCGMGFCGDVGRGMMTGAAIGAAVGAGVSLIRLIAGK